MVIFSRLPGKLKETLVRKIEPRLLSINDNPIPTPLQNTHIIILSALYSHFTGLGTDLYLKQGSELPNGLLAISLGLMLALITLSMIT